MNPPTVILDEDGTVRANELEVEVGSGVELHVHFFLIRGDGRHVANFVLGDFVSSELRLGCVLDVVGKCLVFDGLESDDSSVIDQR